MLARERRVLALNFLFGILLIFVSLTNTDVGTLLFLSICGVVILVGIFLGNKREDKLALRKQRLELLKSNPKLSWLTNLLVIIIPISLGLLSYFYLKFAGLNAFYLTIGSFSVGSF